MEKKLYKNDKDKKLCGVCSGFADYFNVDPTIVRLLWACLCIFAGVGAIAYLVSAIIIPQAPERVSENKPQQDEQATQASDKTEPVQDENKE